MKRHQILWTLMMLLSVYPATAQRVKTGIEVLQETNFSLLKGKKVGLITNPTGVNHRLQSTIDLLHAQAEIKLVALYAPEHGVRGDYPAGEYFESTTDATTGVPVYSIYGKTKKPTKEMLQNVEVLVYDIQDIGSRSYTYISTLGLAMEAAAENNIPFVVLDRPNPLGGIKVEGNLTEKSFTSFVSQYPIPYLHGLTVGELATYLNEEELLLNGKKCNLTVVRMKGWKRTMHFEATGLPWVPSSPHIPHPYSAYFYPMTGIVGELYSMNIGVGYTLPFQLIAAEWIDADSLATNLNNLNLSGLIFRPIHFKPYYGAQKGTMVHGIQIHVTDFEQAPLSLVQFYVLQECHNLWPKQNVFEACEPSRISMFDKVCGTDRIRIAFVKQFKVEDIRKIWFNECEAFKQKTKPYQLYR